jgi:hypothetical protein
MKGRTEHERKGKGNEGKGKVGKMAIPEEQAIAALFTFSLKVKLFFVGFFIPAFSLCLFLSFSVCLSASFFCFWFPFSCILAMTLHQSMAKGPHHGQLWTVIGQLCNVMS